MLLLILSLKIKILLTEYLLDVSFFISISIVKNIMASDHKEVKLNWLSVFIEGSWDDGYIAGVLDLIEGMET